MNYLAHLYLSFNNEDIMVGNFIADKVKGRKMFDYPTGIRNGIMLHRLIDSFTDKHPVVGESKNRIRLRYGKFSGIVVDMYYDHFLAAGWENYSELSLLQFTRDCYKTLFKNYLIIPARLKRILPWMAAGNWLYAYREIGNIGLALQGMSSRIIHNSGIEHGADELVTFYDDFKTDFEKFFPEVISYAKDTINSFEGAIERDV